MALFAPFRVLGDVSSDVPFSTHKRGIETYATTASGRTFHIFDCKKLTLAMLGSMHEADVSLVCAKRDWTFTACSGRKIYCSRRVNVTCELVGHATEVKHLFAFGTLLVSIDRSEHVLVWDISEKVMKRREREYRAFTRESERKAREERRRQVLERRKEKEERRRTNSKESSTTTTRVASTKEIFNELMRKAPWCLRKIKRLEKAKDIGSFPGDDDDADGDEEGKGNNMQRKRSHRDEEDSDEDEDDTFKRVRDMDKLDPDAITGRRYEGEDSDSDEDEGEENDSDDDEEEEDEEDELEDDKGEGEKKDGKDDDANAEEEGEDPMDLAATIMVLPDSFGGSITCIAHPDTYINKVVLGNKRGKLLLLNIVTGRIVKVLGGTADDLETNDAEITFVQNSPALDVIAVGFSDGRCVLYDINKEQAIMTLPHDCKVTCCAFNAQGNQDDNDPLIVVCDVNGTITTWDLEKRRQRDLNQRAHDSEIISCYFFPGQPLLMTSAKDNSLKQWAYDQSDGSSRLLKFRCGHGKPPNLVSFYADGKRIFASGSDKSLRVWSTIQDQQSKELSQSRVASRAKKLNIHEEELKLPTVSYVSWNELREYSWANIASCHEKENKVYTWRLGTGILGENVLETPQKEGDTSECTSCAISQCGSYCFVSYESGAVRRYNMQSGLHRGDLKRVVGVGPDNRIDKNALAKSLKGNEGYNFPGGKKSVWAYSGPQLGSIIDSRYTTSAHDGKCALVQTDGMNRYVCTTGGEDAKVRVWKYSDMKLEGEMDLGAPALHGTGYLHKTAELFAVALQDGTIRLFDIGTKKRVRTFRLNKEKSNQDGGDEKDVDGSKKKKKKKKLVLATKVEITSDREWVISCDTLGMLKVFDIPSARLLQTMKMGSDRITSFALSPTLEYLATTHAGKRGVFLWNNRSLLSTDEGLDDVVESIGGTVELEAPKMTALADDDGNLSLEKGSDVNDQMLLDDDADDEDDMILDAADEMEAKKTDPWEQQKRDLIASIPAQLGPGMATLSLLPQKQLEDLNNLDEIRARKGKDPNVRNMTDAEKEEEQDDFGQVRAPFFLPTKADDTDVRNSAFIVEENGDDDDDDMKKGDNAQVAVRSRILKRNDENGNSLDADCELLRRWKRGAREIAEFEQLRLANSARKNKPIALKQKARTSAYDGPYREALRLLLASTPEIVESEIKSIGPWDIETATEEELEQIGIGIDFFHHEVLSGMNYDAIQALLRLFLASHGETIASNEGLKDRCRKLRQAVSESWERLDGMFNEIRATFSHYAGAH